MNNDTLNIINTRSSIRKYQDRPVPEDLCRLLVEAGLKAPTGQNKQEIHFSVTTGKNPINAEIQKDHDPNASHSFCYDAPLIIYISALDGFKWSDVDAGIAVENIHLAAAALGLGSLIIGCVKDVLNGDKKAYYAEKLAFPDNYSFKIAIGIGYPDTEKTPHLIDYEKNVSIIG